MSTLFVFGSLWFWALFVPASVLLIWALEGGKSLAAGFLFVVTTSAVLFLGNNEWSAWIMAHPLALLGWAVGYLGIGAVYGVVKWWRFVVFRAKAYRREQTRWLRIERGRVRGDLRVMIEAALETGRLSPQLQREWRDYLSQEFRLRTRILQPLAPGHKEQIVCWVAYWPWSGFWTLMNDPIRRLFDRIYDSVAGFLGEISDQVYKGINEELQDDE